MIFGGVNCGDDFILGLGMLNFGDKHQLIKRRRIVCLLC